jgi:hypothetical protein
LPKNQTKRSSQNLSYSPPSNLSNKELKGIPAFQIHLLCGPEISFSKKRYTDLVENIADLPKDQMTLLELSFKLTW